MQRPVRYDLGEKAGMSADEIAAELHVSRQRVNQIIDKALTRLAVQLQRRGITDLSAILPDQHGRHDEA